jgi:FkbM family methyltransferase
VLISVDSLSRIWKVQPEGVLHVGAHLAEEAVEYSRHNWGKVIWIEAQADLADQLKNKLDPQHNEVINAAVWGTSGLTFEFNVSSSTQSSSLLNFGTHKQDYPDIVITKSYSVTTSTLDDILDSESDFNFINLDIQGAELEALKGLGVHINKAKWIYSEVNKKEVYENCSDVYEIDRYLEKHGFKRVATRWVKRQGWGDALYIREEQSISLLMWLKSTLDMLVWIKSQTPSLLMLRRNSFLKSREE